MEGKKQAGGGDAARLQDPLMLAAIQAHGLKESLFTPVSSLPEAIQRRVRALRKMQLDAVGIETDFYRKVHELECQMSEQLSVLSEKRSEIVNGHYEPTDPECDYPLPDEDAESDEIKQKASLGAVNGTAGEKDAPKGIPEFWMTLLKNVDVVSEMIMEPDEAILRHLTDVEVRMSREPMGFKLLFHFSPNDYFTDTVLTKEYTMKCSPDPKEPFEFDGPEIVSCRGCKIDWKTGKNVTVKMVKKKQKHKQKGATRFVTKQVKADSFFNFFDPPEIPEAGLEAMDEEMRDAVSADFEIGQILRDRIIPRAVLYFTGEAHDDESFDEEEDEEDDMDDEGEEEDEDDDGDTHQGSPKAPGEKPQECKQQ